MILNGWAGRMCDCQKKQSEIARLKNAMIPEEFEEARFKIIFVIPICKRKCLTA